MPETYHKILPGNHTMPLSAYALPNPSFDKKTQQRGDPKNRFQQSLLVMPGVLAVHKCGYAFIEGVGTEWDIIVPSPQTENSPDKELPDIKGLFVPSGAVLTRVGLRITGKHEQPGYYTAGKRGVAPASDPATGLAAPEDAGLVGTAGEGLMVSSDPALTGAGAITASGAYTSDTSCVVGPDGRLTSHEESVDASPLFGGTATVTSADLTLKLYNTVAGGPGNGITADLLGGVYVLAEVVYLVPDRVCGFGDGSIKLPGAKYSGYGS
jgi:hypothetical protein